MTAPGRPGFLSSTAGTAALEFAVLAVPFLCMCFGVIEFGRACWTMEALQESAAQGARCIGVVSSACSSGGAFSSSAAQTYIQNVASGWGLSVPTGDITPTQSTTCGGVSGFSKVQISYTFSTIVGDLIPSLKSAAMSVSSCYPAGA